MGFLGSLTWSCASVALFPYQYTDWLHGNHGLLKLEQMAHRDGVVE